MRMINNGSVTVRDEGLLGEGVAVKPGEEVELLEGYCHPRRARNGSRQPSICEQLCPGLEPADEKYREEWKGTPASNWMPPSTAPSAKQFESDGMAPGVAQILAEKAEAELKALQKDKPKPEPVPPPSPDGQAPTIEEYVAAGLPAAKYPPEGYPEVPSPGLTAFREGGVLPTAHVEPPVEPSPKPEPAPEEVKKRKAAKSKPATKKSKEQEL